MSEIVLYGEKHWDSPFVFSVWVALKEKGVEFTEESLDLSAGDQREPAYAGPTLTGKVPALRHADFWLAESLAIVEYLEERFPPPLYTRLWPEEMRARARARQVMAWLRSDLGQLRQERSTATMFFARATEPLGPKAQADADKLVRVANSLLENGEGPLFGEWSIADADLAFALHRLILNAHVIPTTVRTFADREWQRPSARSFIEHARAPLP
jgi:glutathione S-transferase